MCIYNDFLFILKNLKKLMHPVRIRRFTLSPRTAIHAADSAYMRFSEINIRFPGTRTHLQRFPKA